MSGRVRVTLADGRRVTGFRKTLARRAPRRPSHLMPDWLLAIHPRAFGILCLPSGPTVVTGVRVTPDGFVESRGKSRAWVIAQMTAFLAVLGVTTELPAPKRAKA